MAAGGGIGGGGIVVPIIARLRPVLIRSRSWAGSAASFSQSRAVQARCPAARPGLQRVFDAVAQDVAAKIPAR